MKLYPDSSESCGCYPGTHLHLYKPENEKSQWKRIRVAASCRAQPQTATAGQLNYSSGQFCQKLVLSLTRTTSVFCAILTGTHLQNGGRSHFPCGFPSLWPCPQLGRSSHHSSSHTGGTTKTAMKKGRPSF